MQYVFQNPIPLPWLLAEAATVLPVVVVSSLVHIRMPGLILSRYGKQSVLAAA